MPSTAVRPMSVSRWLVALVVGLLLALLVAADLVAWKFYSDAQTPVRTSNTQMI